MELIAHVGFPKAGSTTLQRHFFPHLPDVTYLGRPAKGGKGKCNEVSNNAGLSEVQDAFHQELAINHHFDIGHAKYLLSQLTAEVPRGRTALYSSEFLTSVFFSHPKVEDKLSRLKEVGFQKIIIILRKQSDLIKSQYRDHPFDPKDLIRGQPIELGKWILEAHAIEHSYISSLKYNNLVPKLYSLFGKENVHIAFMEEMSHDYETFRNHLCSFLNTSNELFPHPYEELPSENTGLSRRFNSIRRLQKKIAGELPIHKIIPVKLRSLLRKQLRKGAKEVLEFDDSTLIFLRKQFLNGNIELIKAGFEPMKRYGYDQM